MSMRLLVGVVVVALIAGAVGLGLAGWEGTAIAGLLAALAAVIGPILALLYRTDQQTQTLDKRIQAAVKAGIADYARRSGRHAQDGL